VPLCFATFIYITANRKSNPICVIWQANTISRVFIFGIHSTPNEKQHKNVNNEVNNNIDKPFT